MRLDDLARYGLPSQVLEAWRGRQGDKLLPVQGRAVRQGLLNISAGYRSAGNMIISAPTSSGKSFCGELAAVRVLTDRRKAIMLFPLKSLAEEKYRLFEQTYGSLGIRCLIATADHPENDAAFLSGNYQLAVAIYEKLDLLLTHRLDSLQNVGLIVVDEIQMIGENGRGAVLERLLTKILASGYHPRLLALSAVLANRAVQPLADWLDASLVEETIRPRDLIRGVAAEGELRYRSYNDDHDGREPFANFDSADEDAVGAFITQIKKDTGSALVFLKSRSDAVSLALKLAASVGWPSADKALTRLTEEEPSFLLGALKQGLSHGVAFHNSDLSGYQREVVEQAFIDKEVRALCSTTTLALGVNLPADVVYLETAKYATGIYGGRPELVPITRAEFDNMAGRAGRFSSDRDRPGKAIVLAASSFDRDVLWQAYIQAADGEPIASVFDSLPLEDWLLHLIVTGLADSRDGCQAVLGKTLAAHSQNRRFDLERALSVLEMGGLIRSLSETGKIIATPAGQAAARAGLVCDEAIYFLKCLDKNIPETPFGWICLALSSPRWNLPPGILTWYEQADNLPVKMLYQRFDHSVEEACLFLPASHRREPLSYRAAAALKAGLLLDDWCRLVPVRKLEERFRMHLGQIQSLGNTAAHLVRALGSLVGAIDRESPLSEMLTRQARSLSRGIPPSLESMHRTLGGILNRSDFGAIHAAGIETAEELMGLPPKDREGLIESERKRLKLKELLEKHEEEDDMPLSAMNTSMTGCVQPQSIEIDGSYEADRYLVKINGFPVRLTGKSFKYLTKLAWSRLHRDSGWIFKEDIEVGFNQARYLYRMKGEISAGFHSSWPIVENNRLGYYRLNVAPDGIRVNVGNLKNHPDYEVRSLFSLSGGGVGTVS